MASPAAGTAPFLTKTYAIVDDPETDDIISWNDSGTTFVVWRRSEFERDLLPKNFKHSNFASFVRQLNTYGFKKVGVDRWEFANECFRRGEKHLLGGIQRRKGSGAAGVPASAMIPTAIALPISPTATSSGGDPAVSSSPPPPPPPPHGLGSAVSGAVAELEEEISRLRRENARLSRELARARRAFEDVRRVVTRYDHGGEEEDGAAGGKPMLFGVAIGSKRSREDGDEEDGAEEDGGDEDEEEGEDERQREKARRTEVSDLNVLALSVRAAAAARPPDVGSRGTKNPSVSLPLGSNRAML